MITTEIWKDVIGYEGLYQVSNLGNVRSDKRVLNFIIGEDGYLRVRLKKNGIVKQVIVHTIEWDAFNETKRETRVLLVDHIDEIKTNNRLDNLQLLTNRKNVVKSIVFRAGENSKPTGVKFIKQGKWSSRIRMSNGKTAIGYFDTEEKAATAYRIAEKYIDRNKISRLPQYANNTHSQISDK